MLKRTFIALSCAAALLSPLGLLGGCDSLPGSRTEQATVIGGAGGAVLGAVIAEDNRLLGALIGGALGAGGGYLIGAKTDWFEDDDEDVRREASESVASAQSNPATAAQAREADSADINEDGFVTLDEVVAMQSAGFNDNKMIRQLEKTGQVFDLNASQEKVLRDHGVSERVIRAMHDMNRAERDRLIGARDDDDVIGREP